MDSSSKLPVYMALVLSLIIVFNQIGITGALMVLEIPTANREIVIQMIGNINGAFATVVAYWVGSSSGSATKTAILEKKGPTP